MQGNSSVPSQAFKSKSPKKHFALNGLFIILSFSPIQCYMSREITDAHVMLYSKASSLFSLFWFCLVRSCEMLVSEFSVLEPVVQTAISVV